MDPITIAMLAAQLGPAAMQLFRGIKQNKQSKDISVTDPLMPIPASATEALANARSQASSGYLPGATNMQNMLDQGTANATSDVLRTSGSPLDALAALTTINANNQSNQAEIGFKTAQNANNNQGILRQQLGVMSGWENEKWKNDVLGKFLRDAAAKSALSGAGKTNVYEGVKGVGNAVGSTAGMINENAQLDKILKAMSGGGATPGVAGGPATFGNTPMSAIEQPEMGLQTPNMGTPNTPITSPGMMQSIMRVMQQGGINQTLTPGVLELFKSGGMFPTFAS